MTYQDSIKVWEERIKFLKSGIPLERAVRTIMPIIQNRIFEQGKGSNGNAIGSYNGSDELYVDPDTLPKNIAPRGKPGKEREVQNRKTVYFKSYKALRSEMGRESGKINLRLTNDLQSDWSNAEISKGSNQLGKPNPKKVSNYEYHISLKRDVNIEKAKGLEKRFGPIFAMTPDEVAKYFEILNKELALADA